jgi:hydrogenase maturation protease
MKSRILIVGFGNSLMGDDGAGLALIERLRERGLPEGVRAERGESDSLILPRLWRGEGRTWLVDALISGSEPGSVRLVDHDELLRLPQKHATAHQLGLPESLRWIAHVHPEMSDVRYRLWGIEPASLGPGAGLSPPVAAAVSRVAREMLDRARGTAPN